MYVQDAKVLTYDTQGLKKTSVVGIVEAKIMRRKRMSRKLDEQQLHDWARKIIFLLQNWEGNLTPLQIMQVIDRVDYIMRATQKRYRDKRVKQKLLKERE